MNAPICAYCGVRSKLVTGKDLYPHRPDLYSLNFYQCTPCDAHVGCHKGTPNPLGRLANAELRKMKSAAHAVFDPIWKSRYDCKKQLNPSYKKAMARGGRYKNSPNYWASKSKTAISVCLTWRRVKGLSEFVKMDF